RGLANSLSGATFGVFGKEDYYDAISVDTFDKNVRTLFPGTNVPLLKEEQEAIEKAKTTPRRDLTWDEKALEAIQKGFTDGTIWLFQNALGNVEKNNTASKNAF